MVLLFFGGCVFGNEPASRIIDVETETNTTQTQIPSEVPDLTPQQSVDGYVNYCSDWLKICFPLAEKYVVIDELDPDFPEYSYLFLSEREKASEIAYGDGFMQYPIISFFYVLGEVATLNDVKEEAKDGYFFEFEVIGEGEEVKMGANIFYKIEVKGYGFSSYDYYFLETQNGLYEFKSGDNKALMMELLKSVEFKGA